MPSGNEIEEFKCNARMYQIPEMLDYAKDEGKDRWIRVMPDNGYIYWLKYDGTNVLVCDGLLDESKVWPTMNVESFTKLFWGECGRVFFQDPEHPYENYKYKFPTL